MLKYILLILLFSCRPIPTQKKAVKNENKNLQTALKLKK